MLENNRIKTAINLKQFNQLNEPLEVGSLDLTTPEDRQYILRMLIKRPFEELAVPESLLWTKPLIDLAFINQEKLGVRHPFCYITVRHGFVTTKTDDSWHVDGFSLQFSHLPEQNYVWCSHTPTEYVSKAIEFPSDFDAFKHNIHMYFDDNITKEDKIQQIKEKTVVMMDPYVIHRRPKFDTYVERTFIRVSFTPIEIADVRNDNNSLMPTNYTRDGINEFRNNLIRYTHEM
jgi:hypothetical protein